MKVIQEGKVPATFPDKVVCEKFDAYDSKGCGAALGIGEKDLVPRYYEASHSDKYYFAVRCPRCGKHTKVKGIPQPVFERLMTARARAKATFDGFSDRPR